jgi:peroxin-10
LAKALGWGVAGKFLGKKFDQAKNKFTQRLQNIVDGG